MKSCRDKESNALVDDSEVREGKTLCIWIRDVDDETFARFEEYAYTGDYTAAAVITHNPSVSTAASS